MPKCDDCGCQAEELYDICGDGVCDQCYEYIMDEWEAQAEEEEKERNDYLDWLEEMEELEELEAIYYDD